MVGTASLIRRAGQACQRRTIRLTVPVIETRREIDALNKYSEDRPRVLRPGYSRYPQQRSVARFRQEAEAGNGGLLDPVPALFERAYLMFHCQLEAFQLRQWSGWKHFPERLHPPGGRPDGLAPQHGDVRHRIPAVHRGGEDRRRSGTVPAPYPAAASGAGTARRVGHGSGAVRDTDPDQSASSSAFVKRTHAPGRLLHARDVRTQNYCVVTSAFGGR